MTWVSGLVVLGLAAPSAAAPTGAGIRNVAEGAALAPAASATGAESEPAPAPAAVGAVAAPAPAPEAPPPAAEAPPAPPAGEAPAAPAAAPQVKPAWVRSGSARSAVLAGITKERAQTPTLGRGFHVFDPTYFALGVNTQSLCQAAGWELEASIATISDGMFWGGIYGTAGIQVGRKPEGHQRPSDEDACFEADPSEPDRDQAIEYRRTSSRDRFSREGDGYRYGFGGEFGWRMLGLDFGYLENTSLSNADHGFRLRAGLALSDELFTGGMARYGKQCCSNGVDSAVPCECPRTLVGVSLFFYYAREQYINVRRNRPDLHFGENSVGVSLKLALGLGGGG